MYQDLIEISDLTGTRFKGYEELVSIVAEEMKRRDEILRQMKLEMQERLESFEKLNNPRLNVEVERGFIPQSAIVNETNRVGRNDPCPCGSGKKFKKCCIK